MVLTKGARLIDGNLGIVFGIRESSTPATLRQMAMADETYYQLRTTVAPIYCLANQRLPPQCPSLAQFFLGKLPLRETLPLP